LAALDALDTDIARTRRDHGLHAGFDLLSLLAPAIPSLNAPRPAPKLGAGGWRPVIAFARSWSEKQQARLRQLEERLRELGEKRSELATRAQRLGAERRHGGWQVTGTVTGSGRATLELTYMVAGARWYPSYDVLLDPSTQKVQVGFAGLVSQETGEDWNEALLTLSTAVPATTTAFPKLFTWKVGERDRFIPKPRAPAEPVPPPPPSVPLAREAGDDVGQLRHQLLARAAAAPTTGGEEQRARNRRAQQKQDILRRQARRDTDADAEAEDSGVEGGVESGVFGGAVGGVVGSPAPAAPPMPMARPMPPSAPSSAAAEPPPTMLNESADVEVDALESVAVGKISGLSSGRMRGGAANSVGGTPAGPMLAIGIAPPPGYAPPPVSADLPAALAGGYDLTYKAAGPETVASGKGARRVALFSRSFPVKVERRVFPDLQPEAAYLVAELANPTGQPLPGGEAKLFVGADPAGVARLATVAPGESFTLPLGLDRGIKPVRNVKVVTTQTGLISKDEINEYGVTVELTNPTPTPMRLRLVDQLPVTDDKDVEIKLVRTSPALSQHDNVMGKLEWQLTVPATSKTTVSFVYTLKRPKGYQLRQ
jgi:hypothetical protein